MTRVRSKERDGVGGEQRGCGQVEDDRRVAERPVMPLAVPLPSTLPTTSKSVFQLRYLTNSIEIRVAARSLVGSNTSTTPERPHSSLWCLLPIEFEALHSVQIQT